MKSLCALQKDVNSQNRSAGNASFCQMHSLKILTPTSTYRQFIHLYVLFVEISYQARFCLSNIISCNFIYSANRIFKSRYVAQDISTESPSNTYKGGIYSGWNEAAMHNKQDTLPLWLGISTSTTALIWYTQIRTLGDLFSSDIPFQKSIYQTPRWRSARTEVAAHFFWSRSDDSLAPMSTSKRKIGTIIFATLRGWPSTNRISIKQMIA